MLVLTETVKPKPALFNNNKRMFIVNCLLLYVLTKFLCELPEDGDSAETCRSELTEGIYIVKF